MSRGFSAYLNCLVDFYISSLTNIGDFELAKLYNFLTDYNIICPTAVVVPKRRFQTNHLESFLCSLNILGCMVGEIRKFFDAAEFRLSHCLYRVGGPCWESTAAQQKLLYNIFSCFLTAPQYTELL